MTQPFDGFGDIIEKNSGGCLGGEGIDAHESVRHQYQSDGVVVEVHCTGPRHGGCGKPKHLTIMWPEMIAIKYDLSPHEAFSSFLPAYASEWRVAQTKPGMPAIRHSWYPAGVNCTRCGEMIAPLVEPSECEGHLRQMRRQGWMTPKDEMAISQHCAQMAQQLRRR